MPDQATLPPLHDLPALFTSADEALKRGEQARAETLFRLFVARADSGLNGREVAIARSRLAQIAAMRGQYDEARPLFTEAIEMLAWGDYPAEEAITRYNFAQMLFKLDLFPEAVEQMEAVVALDERSEHPDLDDDRATLEQFRARLTGAPNEVRRLAEPDADLMKLIAAFVNAPDWEASKALVTAEPRLLDPAIDHQFEGLISAAQAQQNLQMAHHLQIHRNLLNNARGMGIEAAFRLISEQPDEALLTALSAFVGAEDWAASRRVLEANPMLLSTQAESLMEQSIQSYLSQDDQDTAYHLSMHLAVLRSAREVGYAEAFRRIDSMPSEELASIIAGFANCIDNGARKLYLEMHPELLTDECDDTFEILVQAAQAMGDNPRAALLSQLRDLTRVARVAGMDEAFIRAAPLPSDSDESEEVDAMVVVSVVAHNTLAVMKAQPEKRDAWLENISLLHAEAARLGDAQMLALLDAVEAVLRGRNPATVNPDLQLEYKAAWDQIVSGLSDVHA